MSAYQVLKENEGEATPGNLPPYAATTPAPAGTTTTPRGFVYIPLTNRNEESNTETVVAGQPQALPQVTVQQPPPKTKPGMLIFTIVLAIICGIHLCIPAFCCLTPALIFAIVGYSLSDSPSDEQKKAAKAFHGVALCCNVFTIIFYAVSAVFTIVIVGTWLGLYLEYSEDYYYNGGCYDDCTPQYDEFGNYLTSSCSTVCY